MNLLKYLQAQGLGTRKSCLYWIRSGLVCINGQVCADEKALIEINTVENVTIAGEAVLIIPQPYYYILLNKPAYYETSHKPRDYPSVFTLLPDQLRATPIQAIGRLDADTTGVLLLTNDGQFNHRMTSPKHKVSKLYRVILKYPAHQDLCVILEQGVLLHDDNETVCALEAQLESINVLLLTINEGKYHQVKRMIAAAGNRVEALHRVRFGHWDTQGLEYGEWRFIKP